MNRAYVLFNYNNNKILQLPSRMTKKIVSSLVLLLVYALFSFSLKAQSDTDASIKNADLSVDTTSLYAQSIHPLVEREVARILMIRHYKKFRLDDSLSKQMFDFYLESFDNNRSVFLASDVSEFQAYKYQLDNNLQRGDLSVAFLIFNRFKIRFDQRLKSVVSILEKEFDYSINEEYFYDRKELPWPKTQKELDELWEKVLKNQALDLKLAGKKWEEIQKTLFSRYKNQAKAISQYKSEDIFQIYMNSFTRAIDPHTNYFSPSTSDNFRINMSQSLEGIGAQLQSENDYTKVAEVIPGGPAFKSKLIKKGDKIVGVAQGDTGKFVDVIGWRLDDVVALIRGPKGTIVRLQIIAAEDLATAPPREIKLTRDKVKLENQTAKKEVKIIKTGAKSSKIGVITIPTFYMDFEAYQRGEANYNSTSRDVRRLVGELQSEKVEGIIIDLRNNGGGSLMEAIELSGLFIPQGPVVQVKDASGRVEINEDDDPAMVYNGPLGVLINRFSASASEIFAGAMQDYNRAIIIGENSYGKGTVQTLDDLNRRIQIKNERLGQLKFTTAKFYRVTGSSTQHKGVLPDINFPSAFSAEEFGEDSEPTALPWDEITTAPFKPMAKITPKTKELLQKKHAARVKKNDAFQSVVQEIQWAKKERAKKSISLLETERKKERDAAEARRLARNKKVQLKGKTESPAASNQENAEKEPDIYLDEAGQILTDLVNLRIG
ncbi:MAG: carboxy terminal-processing peptidase [Chloroherpetonaceae bacterium]|nr:carboxy terminal-processing peptidase [Chloroherpetonaceae bacterium]